MASTAPATLLHAVITSTGSVGSMRSNPLQQVQPFLTRRRVSRIVQIDERKIHVGGLDTLQRLARRAGLDDVVAFVAQQQAQGVEDVRLVVGDEHAHGDGIDHWHSSSICGFRLQPEDFRPSA